uniref:PDZ domain-containing protein n=1 Tax=Salarias fasciatus TaxID=181472 RepID=A0A672HBV5_SALFA
DDPVNHPHSLFGFRLRMDLSGPHRLFEITDVKPWSPADQSGLRDGDRVLEVNEESVENTDFSLVTRTIQACGFHLFLMVLSREEYEQAVCSDVDLQTLAQAVKGEGWSKPRLCNIVRDPDQGLGMTILPVNGQKGQFMISTVTDGPAEKTGVLSGDRLMWINGVMASTLTHTSLNRIVKKSGDLVTVLVVDINTHHSYIRRKMPLLPTVAKSSGLLHMAKTIHLVKGPDGYGFFLRQERQPVSRRLVHVLRDVDVESPAEAAGMEDGDLLLAVNWELVETAAHEDIVRKIRRSGDKVTLTTMSIPGRDFYREVSRLMSKSLPVLSVSQHQEFNPSLFSDREISLRCCSMSSFLCAARGAEGKRRQRQTCPRSLLRQRHTKLRKSKHTGMIRAGNNTLYSFTNTLGSVVLIPDYYYEMRKRLKNTKDATCCLSLSHGQS